MLEMAIQKQGNTFTKSDGSQDILNLYTKLGDVDYQNDPIVSYDCAKESVEEIDPNRTIYQLFGYDELVPNDRFASLLNYRGEICVGDTMYKISSKGTYYFPLSERDYFEQNYAFFETIDGTPIAKNTYKLSDDIFRYDTFAGSCEIEENNETIDSHEVYYQTKTDPVFPSFSWSSYPTYYGDADDYLDDQIFTYALPDNRRIKTRVYYHNYVVYKERGAYVKCQKKVVLGWDDVVSDALQLTWNNLIMRGSHLPSEIPPSLDATITTHTETVTYEGANYTMLEMTGYVLPSSVIDNIVRGTTTVRSVIQSATGYDIGGIRLIRLSGHDYVQFIFVGSWTRAEADVEEVKYAIAHDWFSGVPRFEGGQFMYAAVDDHQDFGALRVGTIF